MSALLQSWKAEFDRRVFTSAEQVITSAGTLTLAHGLGAAPRYLLSFLKCLTAEGGYAVGDVMCVNPGINADSAVSSKGNSIIADATNIYVRFGSNATAYSAIQKGTGGFFDVVNANWRLIVRAIL